jgi:hypothetical protein
MLVNFSQPKLMLSNASQYQPTPTKANQGTHKYDTMPATVILAISNAIE